MKTLLWALAVLASSVPAVTLDGTKAEMIPAAQVKAEIDSTAVQAAADGHGTGVLARYGNLALQVSVLTRSGEGEIHAHLDDLMIVQQGSATLITGGTLVDRRELPNGSKGSGILNGKTQILHVGDVVIIPAGVPHQLLIAPGMVYSSLVAKIKES
jgi:mannose-6-phosphate isomerase-like protein (cupin superfamily)